MPFQVVFWVILWGIKHVTLRGKVSHWRWAPVRVTVCAEYLHVQHCLRSIWQSRVRQETDLGFEQ